MPHRIVVLAAIAIASPVIALAEGKCPVVSTIDEIEFATALKGELSLAEKARRLDEGISKLQGYIRTKTRPSGGPMDAAQLADCKNQLSELQRTRRKLR